MQQSSAGNPPAASRTVHVILSEEDSPDGREVISTGLGHARVRSGVMRLHQDGKINDDQVFAAERWYRDYMFVEHDVTCPSIRPGAASKPGSRMDARVDAAASYRAACRSVGRSATAVLIDVVGLEIAMSKAAPKHGSDRNAFPGLVVGILRRLAEHYADADIQHPQSH